MSRHRDGHIRRVFGMPAAIASASLLGLVSALVGDGVFDVMSWVAFTGIIAIVSYKLLFREKATARMQRHARHQGDSR